MRIQNPECIANPLSIAAAFILTPDAANNPGLQPFTIGDFDHK